MTAGFIIATALDYRLPFKTWTVAQGIKRHIHRDINGAPWTEDMALRLCVPVHEGGKDPKPANDNEEAPREESHHTGDTDRLADPSGRPDQPEP